MARYCIDASFVVGRLLGYSVAIAQRWDSISARDELVAPYLLRAECTSVLNRHVHARRLDEARGRLQVERMLRLPIRIVEGAALYLRAFDVARSLGWAKAYDALYLATAEHEAAELLTVDGAMHAAALRLGIRATLVD